MAITSPSPNRAAISASTRPKAASSCLRIDHPEDSGEGVMRRYRMVELQEAYENMIFCSAEVRHFGGAGRPAEHRDEGQHKQFT